ncbi:hypothetical protein H072_7672 [Dactylellina haptotyla CBS 200.50]|uniref:DNA damage-responsive protein 48 n=1 Tax=Dactylellina haptotyla (strain CBS 200.50) TaxID=1284197 RepID=S8BTJ9_DACHA|nr:hypothetical protein H072_7672 [Dactylellina haptotyla CBS 200.50]
MDFLKDLTGDKKQEGSQPGQPGEQKQGGLGGLMDQAGGFLNNKAGGGAEGEKKEDYLDKGVDMFQERVLGQGPQNNESAAEQAKDEMISDAIRDNYKKFAGKDVPIADK